MHLTQIYFWNYNGIADMSRVPQYSDASILFIHPWIQIIFSVVSKPSPDGLDGSISIYYTFTLSRISQNIII